jgi:aminoglycoside phosphotransferase (APT) family kinase protein
MLRRSSESTLPAALMAQVLGSPNVDGFGLEPGRPFQARRVDRPGDTSRRWVIHFFPLKGAPAKHLFVKQYSATSEFRQDVANEFKGLRIAHDAFGSTGCFRAPEPYTYDVGERTIVMEYCPSVTLDRMLFRHVRWSGVLCSAAQRQDCLRAASQVGELLRRFQSIPPRVGGPEDALQRSLAGYRDHFLGSLTRCKSLGVSGSDLARVRTYVCDRLCMPPNRPEVVLQHTDFGPWNLLLGEGCLYVVDFHNFGAGFPAYDAAYFHTALGLWRRFRTVSPALIDEAQSAFLKALLVGPDSQTAAGSSATDAGTGMASMAMPMFRALSAIHMSYFASIILSRRIRTRELAYLPVSRLGFVQEWFRTQLEDA